MAPTPAAYPSPQGRATLAGRWCPLGLDPPATPPSRRPGRAEAPAVTGPLAQRRQRPRRRITPNTNTSTTTMISTHNHVDMAASLVGAGAVQADATAAHPSKQLGHRQASSRARIDGRATRARGTPAPRDLPADLGWPDWCQTGSRPRAGPGGAEPFGPRPAQPPHPAPHQRRTRQAATDPMRPQRPRPAGDGEAEKRLPCLGGGTIQAWLC